MSEHLQAGQKWREGISSPGYVWHVERVEGAYAHLTLHYEGEPTLTYLQWPVNRPWSVMVERNQLTLVKPGRPKKSV